MQQRGPKSKRELLPDPKYQSLMVSKLTNRVMSGGNKSVARRIIYGALDIIEQQEKTQPVTVVEQALKNVSPLLEVKPRRVGGATYQVPQEVRAERSLTLAIRWLIKTATSRSGRSMAEKLAAELIDASKGQGATVKKRDDTHKMAEANRAFAHYKW